MSVIEHGPRDRSAVALTFDADVSRFLPVRRPVTNRRPHQRILELLRANQVRATLFLTGLWLEVYPDDARALRGDTLFELGNHSYSHEAFAAPCYGLPVMTSAERKRDDVLRADRAIKRATGRRPRYFRFPGGCYTAADARLVRSLGLEPVAWDVLSGDSYDDDATSVAGRILSSVGPGSIVVMHLSEPQRSVTADVLELVLPELRARMLEPVTLTELLS